jgi:A/G-specific adenine glycosylase
MTWFSDQVLAWFDQHGRTDLPWQRPRTPYRVWVSEVMLQQTQVATVVPYFERFVQRFPNVAALARAQLDDVLHLWTGLGYYARGRNLHKAAQHIVASHDGELPCDLHDLLGLPGIGRSTAGAILSVGFGRRAPILDGNVKRVLARFHAIDGHPSQTAVANEMWRHAESHTPTQRVADYTQAIMDLGALACTRASPHCDTCPLEMRCVAHQTHTVPNYPTPRPAKKLPVRRAKMYLVTDDQRRCLLERRPPTGLWGGLWSPPERAADYADATFLDELGTACAAQPAALPIEGFRHTFTHFHLDIDPVHLPIGTAPLLIADGERWQWYHPSNNQPLGLSAVAVKLLRLVQPTVET